MSRRFLFSLRLITAILLAAAAAIMVDHFTLLTFAYAPICVFASAALGFFWLSAQYEPIFHALLLGVALFLFAKAVLLTPIPSTPFGSTDRDTAAGLVGIMAEKLWLQTQNSTSAVVTQEARLNPDAVEWIDDPSQVQDLNKNVKPNSPKLWLKASIGNSDDNTKTIWYVSDTFRIFQTTAQGWVEYHLMPPALSAHETPRKESQ